jgi:hypothetical protein
MAILISIVSVSACLSQPVESLRDKMMSSMVVTSTSGH